MQDIKNKLKSELKGAKRIAVLGVGSELRADDVAGIIAAQELEKSPENNNASISLKVFLGYTAPENLSGEIKKFEPTHVIIIDAAEIGKKHGEAELFSPENVGGISFSTHKLPIKVLAQYLTGSMNCRVMIIGIQPKILEFGGSITKEVEQTAINVAAMIRDAIS